MGRKWEVLKTDTPVKRFGCGGEASDGAIAGRGEQVKKGMFSRQKKHSSLKCWWPGARREGERWGAQQIRGSGVERVSEGVEVWKGQGNQGGGDREEAGRAEGKEEGVWTPAVCRVVYMLWGGGVGVLGGGWSRCAPRETNWVLICAWHPPCKMSRGDGVGDRAPTRVSSPGGCHHPGRQAGRARLLQPPCLSCGPEPGPSPPTEETRRRPGGTKPTAVRCAFWL